MSFGNLVSMLGAAAGGVNRGLEQAKADKEREAERKFRDEQRARMLAEQDRAEKTRLGLAEAMAPTQAQAQEVAGPTMDGAPLNVYKAGGQGFPSMAEATTAAGAYNSPEARLQRGSDVLAAQGDAAGSVRMVGDAQRSKLTGMQVKQAEQAQADHAQLREFAGALQQGGWSAVPKIYDRYNDGFGASVTEDGKGGASIQRMKDGKPVGAPIQFASLPEFFTTVAGRFDPEKWMADTRATEKDKTDRAYKDRELGLREKVANAQVAHYQRMGTGGDGELKAGKLPEVVRLQHSGMKGQYDKLSDAIIKAKAEGMWNPKDPNAQQLLAQQAMLEVNMTKLLAPYVSGGQADADPLGLNKAEPAAPAPAAQPAKPAPRMADEVKPKPKPAPTQERSSDPLKGLSRQQIREKRVSLESEIERWRGKPNAGNRVQELQSLIERIDNGQY